jgi:protein-disulfide isomerase
MSRFALSTSLSMLAALTLAPAAMAQVPPAPPSVPAVAPAPVAVANAPVTRDQIPALVREALLKDPEMLAEAIEKLQDKKEERARAQAKEGIAKQKDAIYNNPMSPSVGDAKTTDINMVVFFDYHCGYCKQILPAVTKLVEEDKKLRVIFKEFPILSEDSVLASRAAIAVYKLAPEKYFAFHTALMNSKGAFEERTLLAEAKKLGIDTAELKKKLTDVEISKALDKNREIGEALGIRGTPALIIGEDFFPGALAYEDMKKAIEDARKPSAAPKAEAPKADAPVAPTAPAAAPTPAKP